MARWTRSTNDFLLVWPRQRDVRGERRVFVWERAAVGDRPAAASQPSAEHFQLAQWIVNDLTPKVGP